MSALRDLANLPEPELRLRALVAGIEHVHRPAMDGWHPSMGTRTCSECTHPWPCNTYRLIVAWRRLR